jgi:hypothetical protein
MLVAQYETVEVEGLNVIQMVPRVRGLADPSGWCGNSSGTQTDQPTGTPTRRRPSSKKCSACGAANARLFLADGVVKCERYGLVIERDVNAARNLVKLGVLAEPASRDGKLAGSGTERPCGAKVRGRPHDGGRPRGDPGKTRQRWAHGDKARTAAPPTWARPGPPGAPRSWLRGAPSHRAPDGGEP